MARLAEVVAVIRRHTRSYDLVVRTAATSFCVDCSTCGLDEVAQRFARIDADLAAAGASVTTGLALLTPQDSLGDLIRRADDALYRQRALRKPPL